MFQLLCRNDIRKEEEEEEGEKRRRKEKKKNIRDYRTSVPLLCKM